jgi:hypothetical protein
VLEYNGDETIFSIAGGTPTPTPTTVTYSSGWTGSLSYGGAMAMIASPTAAIAGDMLPIVVIVIGISLGLYLLTYAIERFSKKDKEQVT